MPAAMGRDRGRVRMALVTLRVLHGADRGRVFHDLPTPVTIGREEGNSIQLNDERISRYHLKFQEDSEKIVVTDLESTNGTKVNGEDVQVRIIRHGDMIAVGRSLLLFGSHSDIDRRIAAIAAKHPPRRPATRGNSKNGCAASPTISRMSWTISRRSAHRCCRGSRRHCPDGSAPRSRLN